MADRVRWGILGTGSIAKQFAKGLEAIPDADLVAVGSRSQETADAFGEQFKVKKRHASYEALAEDGEVDAVYVATPHSLHKENSIMCLRAGKAVLCEKPFTINSGEAQDVVDVARETGIFLMEAMWSRFLPVMVRVREWLAEGKIGEVKMLAADFGFGSDPNAAKSRLYDPALGGGALMDVGIYPVSFASMVMGRQPVQVQGMAHIGERKVDEQAGMVFGYDGGEIAMLYTSIRNRTPHQGYIMGTKGMIHIHPPFWKATKATLLAGKDEETVEIALEGNGYNYEAVEVMGCLREGKKESEGISLVETVEIMKTMDEVRAQVGVKFPME